MQKIDENKLIIDRIRTLRNEHGLSQGKFAKLIEVSPGNVSSWEAYKSLPGSLALKKISLILGCSVDWILFGDKIPAALNVRGTCSIYQTQTQQQKNEAVFDLDLKRMIDILKEIMSSDNQHLRSWAIIQFEDSFSKYCSIYDEKKRHA